MHLRYIIGHHMMNSLRIVSSSGLFFPKYRRLTGEEVIKIVKSWRAVHVALFTLRNGNTQLFLFEGVGGETEDGGSQKPNLRSCQ